MRQRRYRTSMTANASSAPVEQAATRRGSRHRKIRTGRITVLLLVLCGLGLWACSMQPPGFMSWGGTHTGATAYQGAVTSEMDTEQLWGDLTELALHYPAADAILARPQDYPLSLLELVARNPETLDFVLNYPSRAELQPQIDISAEAAAGELPLFLQWDERWGYQNYGSDMLAITGCGPTCLSMVAVLLTGNANYHPWYLAQVSQAHGYYVAGSGTAWSFMESGAKLFGLNSEQLSLSENVVYSCLRAGQPIICAMRAGDFTSSGHFIVLAGVAEDGGIRVHDPNSLERSGQSWDFATLEPQINNLWAYTLK